MKLKEIKTAYRQNWAKLMQAYDSGDKEALRHYQKIEAKLNTQEREFIRDHKKKNNQYVMEVLAKL